MDKHSRSRTEYLVKARSQFKERSTATSVEIMLPLPPDAISPTVRTSQVGCGQRMQRGQRVASQSSACCNSARPPTASLALPPPHTHLQGSAVYAPEKDALVWKIKNFPGGREFLLRCKFGLPSVAAEEEAQGRLPPIKVKFEVRRGGVGAAFGL